MFIRFLKTARPAAAFAAVSAVFILFSTAPGLAPGQGLPDEDYLIGPRDVIVIELWGEENMKMQTDVTEEGNIHYFFIGEVHVAGLTVKQVREKMTALLSEYFKAPIVSLRIAEFRSKEVLIIGAVKVPGVYYLNTNTTQLIKLISMAGGTDAGRGSRGIIYRGGTEKIKDLKPAPGPEQADKPGGPVESGNTVSPASYQKIEKELRDLPGIERVEVNLAALLDFGDPAEDKTIYPNDIVIISSDVTDMPSRNFVWVGGEVKTPGKINWQPGLTVSQAITQAGGITDYGAPNRTIITRQRPDGQVERIKVKLKNIQRGTLPDIALEPGDQITVRESIF